jgi:D-alanyl-D-alanine dipeptidase
MDFILIGDQKIKDVPVKECGDAFVDFVTHFQELAFDLERKYVQKKSLSISLGRKTVGEMLVKAQSTLPKGIHFLIKECYRPLSVQRESFEGYCAFLRSEFPGWDEEQIYNECSKLNAPVDVAPHSTGGAVDLTLIDDEGNWLDMGTTFNAEPMDTEYATYTAALNISDKAKHNRAILNKAMIEAGFVNYPTEWWHWSYGDKYWAYTKKMPNALFSSMEDFPESMR